MKSLLISFIFIFSATAVASNNTDKTYELEYRVQLMPIKKNGELHLFLPLAQSNENQIILKRNIISPVKGNVEKDNVYGNEYWHLGLSNAAKLPKQFEVTVKYLVKRHIAMGDNKGIHKKTPNKKSNVFLKENSLVPIGGKLIERVKKDINLKDLSDFDKAKNIFSYVVENMEYKKVGTGWGNGDTYWACSKKYGNCTDFHALFTSLARSENIPTRFEIGFPIPKDKNSGTIGGYHCWINFYSEKGGWAPLDASETKKLNSKKISYFNFIPADRVQFTTGRDIKLGKHHKSAPLNYFIYPHLEINGIKSKAATMSVTFKKINR